MKHIFIILLIYPFFVFGQIENPIVPEKLNDYFHVSNHPKSIHNFSVRIPDGFNNSREGNDNSTVKVFRNYINTRLVEFSINTMKWEDFSEYQMFLSMTNKEVEDHLNKIFQDRIKNFPNELLVFYKKHGFMWTIVQTWDKDKSIYIITGTTYTNKQSIGLGFYSGFEGNQKEDLKNIKKLIDSFEYRGE